MAAAEREMKCRLPRLVLAIAHDLQVRIKREDIFSIDDVFEKYQTEKITPPFHMMTGPPSGYIEQLMWSELGDYVRNLLRKEKG